MNNKPLAEFDEQAIQAYLQDEYAQKPDMPIVSDFLNGIIEGARWQHQQLVPRVAALEEQRAKLLNENADAHLLLKERNALEKECARLHKIYLEATVEHPTYKLSKELEAEVARLREALEFYAETGNCDTEGAYLREGNIYDGGLTAREALREALSGREEGGG